MATTQSKYLDLLEFPVETLFLDLLGRHLDADDIIALSLTSRRFRNIALQFFAFNLRTEKHPSCISSMVATIKCPEKATKPRILNQRVVFDENDGEFIARVISSPMDDPICVFWQQNRTNSLVLPPILDNTELAYLARVQSAVEYFTQINVATFPCKEPWPEWRTNWSNALGLIICRSKKEEDCTGMTPCQIIKRALFRFELHRRNPVGALDTPYGQSHLAKHDLRDADMIHLFLQFVVTGLLWDSGAPYIYTMIAWVTMSGLSFVHNLAMCNNQQRRKIFTDIYCIIKKEESLRLPDIFSLDSFGKQSFKPGIVRDVRGLRVGHVMMARLTDPLISPAHPAQDETDDWRVERIQAMVKRWARRQD